MLKLLGFKSKDKEPEDGDIKVEDGEEVVYSYWGNWQPIIAKKKSKLSDYLDNSLEQLEKKKQKSGNPNLIIVDEQANQLMLDYDYEEVPPIFKQMLPILNQRTGPVTWKAIRSSSGNHWHVVIDMPVSMEPIERVAWQAVFGSDSIKESLSLMRIHKGIEHPIVLFMDPTVTPELEGNTIVAGRKFREE